LDSIQPSHPDLSKPRSVREILATVALLYAGSPLLFLSLALAVVGPYELIVFALTSTAPPVRRSGSLETSLVLLLIAFALVGPLVSALYVHALAALREQQRPSIASVGMRAIKVLPVVAAAQIIAGITIGIGFLLFIIPGVWLAIRFAVVAQVAALEETDWPGALQRSGALTRHNYLRIFALLLCVSAFTVVLTRIGVRIVGNNGTAAAVVLGVVVATLTQSFQALCTAVLYFDLRARTPAAVA
jgi:hypothetical protein